jgi:membrane-bound ClpP family serine protease
MCHLIFFIPVFGLPVLWMFPFHIALPVYLFILFVSLVFDVKIFQAMHMKVKTGREAMLGKTAVVIQNVDPEGKIQIATEIWNAFADGGRFLTGQKVKIVRFQGLSLLVEAASSETE